MAMERIRNLWPWRTTTPPRRSRTKLSEFQGVGGPSGQDFRAGGLHVYSNEASRLTVNDYNLIRTTDCTADPPAMLGAECAKARPRVFGPVAGIDPHSPEAEDPANRSDRAKWLQAAWDNSDGLIQLLQASPWALIYEVLFWQVRWQWVEGFGLAPVFSHGERYPKWAGGHLHLAPNHEDIVVEEIMSFEGTKPAETLSPRDWIILKPGPGAHPRGGGWLALRFKRNAQRAQTGDVNREVFGEQMSIPVVIWRWLSGMLPVGKQGAKWDELEEEFSLRDAMDNLVIGETGKTIAEILRFPPDGVKFLQDEETRIAARCMKAIMLTALLADTRATGPTGSSKEARSTANGPVLAFLDFLAGRCTKHVHPAMIEVNESFAPGSVPPIKPGEIAPRVQFVYAGEMPGDTNPTKDSAADRVPQEKRPVPEGTGTKEEDADEVE